MIRVLLAPLAVLALSVFVFPSDVWASKVHGTFRVVKGEVKVRSGKDGQLAPAKLGTKVFPKDTIITGKDSRAKVVMVDNNEINVSPESEIVFQDYEFQPEDNKKNVLLNVIYGKVRSKVNQKYDDQGSNQFRVKTPSAVAGVRGTDFLTSYDSGSRATQVVTFKGEVAFGLPGPDGSIVNPVSVTPGQFTNIVPGQPPAAPQPVPAAQLADMEKATDAEVAATPKSGADDSRNPAGDEKGGKKPPGESAPADKSGDKPATGSGEQKRGEGQPAASGPREGGGSNVAGGGPGAPKGEGRLPLPGLGAPSGERGPASTGPSGPMAAPGVMLRPTDLPSGGSGPILVPELANNPILPPPQFQLPDALRNCDFCRETVESGNRRLIIRVTNGN